jgi:uncharacterized membrane protein
MKERITILTHNFFSRGIINAFGVFETYYEQHTLSHQSPSSIAWIGSVQSALLMVVGIVSGPLFDGGYFYALLPTGTFLVVLGMMMTSLSTKYYQIMLAQGICVLVHPISCAFTAILSQETSFSKWHCCIG